MTKSALQDIISKHALFTCMLFELLKSLLNRYEINYHIIEQRTKTIESLEDKIVRKGITNVTEEITDISGLRIILYYQDDVEKIIDFIKDNFAIDEKNSINKAELYNSNEFGYLSIHYIISLNGKRENLPEWQTFSTLKAELQIRTVLQHSWASISHELSYKKDYEIPNELQRKLFRLAGLFELADEQFLKIRDEHNLLKKSIEKISHTSEMDLEKINLLTLKYSLQKENSIYTKIEQMAERAGFSKYKDQSLDDKFISQIVLASDLLGYSKILDIEDNLRLIEGKMEIFLKKLFSKSNRTWYGTRGFYNLLAILFLLNENQLREFQTKANWTPEIFKSVVQTIKTLKNSEAISSLAKRNL
jgi:putative GTP pyrophosphokinase